MLHPYLGVLAVGQKFWMLDLQPVEASQLSSDPERIRDFVNGCPVQNRSHVDLRLRVEDRLEVGVDSETLAYMRGEGAQWPAM